MLYGGFDEAGFAPEVHLFDVGRRRWCGAEDRPAVRGRAPAPRAGHTGSALGRHAMVVYGGRGEDGLLQELHALQMHSTKPADGGPPRVTLCWSRTARRRRRPAAERARTTRAPRWTALCCCLAAR